jgi:hypothetical protein
MFEMIAPHLSNDREGTMRAPIAAADVWRNEPC